MGVKIDSLVLEELLNHVETDIPGLTGGSKSGMHVMVVEIRKRLRELVSESMKISYEEFDKDFAIMRNIATGDDPHGHFLTYFAKAACQADLENQRLIYPTIRRLVEKYDLERRQLEQRVLRPEQYQKVAP